MLNKYSQPHGLGHSHTEILTNSANALLSHYRKHGAERFFEVQRNVGPSSSGLDGGR